MIVLVCLESPSPSPASRAALRLARGMGDDAEVVVLSAGSAEKCPSLEWARQSEGVRRVVQVRGATLDTADFLTLGMVLAEAARHLEAGLVLAGDRSDGEGQGLVPAAIAHHLRAPHFARVMAAEFPPARNDVVQATVRSGGRLCKITSPLPVVLTTSPVLSSIDSWPVTERGSSRAIETLSLAQLGLDASQMVPRPDLLGTLVPAPAENARYQSFDEVAPMLLRRP